MVVHKQKRKRPYPLQGRYMANIFVHFEPIGTTDVKVSTGDLPPYVIPGSPEEAVWRKQHPSGWSATRGQEFTTGTTEAHISATKGDERALRKILDRHADQVNAKDSNGWTPLHEAVRSGRLEAVKLLVERGADVNALTNDGRSPLHHAKKYHKRMTHNNAISHFLQSHGAREFGPEL
jgi:prolyl 4-hydroxylase